MTLAGAHRIQAEQASDPRPRKLPAGLSAGQAGAVSHLHASAALEAMATGEYRAFVAPAPVKSASAAGHSLAPFKHYRRYLPALGICAAVGVAVGLVWLLINYLNSTPAPRPVRIQQVSLLPPPPPPPPVEKPPEPEIEKTPIDVPEDVPMDASDPVATENTSGSGPTIRRGKAGAGIGVPFGSYSAGLAADIRDWIAEDRKLRRNSYAVELKLWIATTGRIERAELSALTGDAELDRRLKSVIAGFVGKVLEPPPGEMPQPVRLGVKTRS
ncbi:MAG: hypothetical protein L0Y32_03200 [Nevskiales bacterium]|nr:hypothetical protein [Nevskiales bacterium]